MRRSNALYPGGNCVERMGEEKAGERGGGWANEDESDERGLY